MRLQLLIPKLHKDITKRENYRPILLMNIDSEKLSKYWQTESKNTSKKIIHHDQVAFIPEMQGWLNMKICQCNPPYKQTEKKAPHDCFIIC